MRCVFVGTPGYLGRIDGQTRCAFWAEDPQEHGLDPARLIEVDLARTPSAAQAKEIEWGRRLARHKRRAHKDDQPGRQGSLP
jgi:hypothetical protein